MKSTNNTVTYDKLINFIVYDANTGIFKKKSTNKILGSDDAYGYRTITITISKVTYKAHRLAWFYYYNEWPEEK